jgi:hypothetical protein
VGPTIIRSAVILLAVASMTGGVSTVAAGSAQCASSRPEACRSVATSDELSSATRVRRPLRIEVRRTRIEVRRPYFVPGPPDAMPPNYYLFVNGRLSGPYFY